MPLLLIYFLSKENFPEVTQENYSQVSMAKIGSQAHLHNHWQAEKTYYAIDAHQDSLPQTGWRGPLLWRCIFGDVK